jgi:hypothetical protein
MLRHDAPSFKSTRVPLPRTEQELMSLYRAYVGDDNATDFTRDFIQDRNVYQGGHDTIR